MLLLLCNYPLFVFFSFLSCFFSMLFSSNSNRARDRNPNLLSNDCEQKSAFSHKFMGDCCNYFPLLQSIKVEHFNNNNPQKKNEQIFIETNWDKKWIGIQAWRMKMNFVFRSLQFLKIHSLLEKKEIFT